MTCTAGSTSCGTNPGKAFFNIGKVLRHWGLVWREQLNYGDVQGWVRVYLLAWGICKAIRWPAAPVSFPLEPGVHHSMTAQITPCYSKTSLRPMRARIKHRLRKTLATVCQERNPSQYRLSQLGKLWYIQFKLGFFFTLLYGECFQLRHQLRVTLQL